jgi:hypothetical protein
MRRQWVAVLGVMLATAGVGIAGEQPGPSTPSNGTKAESDSEVRALFEMCCQARGRAGFNYCEQYGFCVDNPGSLCTGRGPAEGRQLQCQVPPDSERNIAPRISASSLSLSDKAATDDG